MVVLSSSRFPKICLHLPSLLPRRQNHHPRVLPKAFQWEKSGEHVQEFKVKWSRTKKFYTSRSRSRSPYIGSPLNISYAEFFRFMLQFLCLQMCVWGGDAVPQGVVGDRHRFKSCSCAFSAYLLLCACMCEEGKAWETNVEHHTKNGVKA